MDSLGDLRCPACRNQLVPTPSFLNCSTCGLVFPIVDGIPVLLSSLNAPAHDESDRHSWRRRNGRVDDHKEAQAGHSDHAEDPEFEIDRPHGTARLYRFLLAEKFRRAADPIRLQLAGCSALTVCGGSGMDAEFLALAGAIVVSSDLSLGAARRVGVRSERHGSAIQSIVADVENLPFADEAVDLVAVHDGLHHLDDPWTGLAEMARVARRWVVVTEPARAAVTRLAILLGMALETEEAGNRVARMRPEEVAAYLSARGYHVLRAERYAMYYPHHPGRVFDVLSRPYVFPVIRAGWRVANAVIGRFGNKMVVVAERSQPMSEVVPSMTPSPRRTTS
jgi:SAM-dependent methyltransferase